jgi:hypothetical protein
MDLSKALRTGLVLATVGCSTTTTIVRTSGPTIEGEVVGGSRDTIFVRRGSGTEDEIPRDDISELDYPGNVHAGFGGALLGYGLLNIAVGFPQCEKRNRDQAAFCTGVFLPAVLGAGMTVWGLVVNRGQAAAVADTSRPSGTGTEKPSAGIFPSWARKQRSDARPREPGVPTSERSAPPPATPAPAPSQATTPTGTPPSESLPAPSSAPESPATPDGSSKSFPVGE